MMQITQMSLLVLLVAVLSACTATTTNVSSLETTTPLAPATRTLPPKTATPVVAATTTISPTAELLLRAQPIDYCEPSAPTRGCGKPLALQIVDYLQRHPDDPQALALWRRIISIGQPTQEIGADDPQQMDSTWAYDGWAEAEFLALDLPSELTVGQPSLEIDQLTIMPTNLDGDATQDYLLSTTFSSGHDELGKLRWMRWQHGRWVGEHVLSYDNEFGAQVQLGDVTGDAQPELLVRSSNCGSACSGRLYGWTWRDGVALQLFPDWADTGDLSVSQNDPTPSVSSPDANYRFDGQYLSPAELALPTGEFSNTIGAQIRHAHGLLVLGRFDEAIMWLERAANQADGSAYFGYKTTFKDARPVALFRIGAIHLLKHNPLAAQVAWAQVVQHFPRSLAAAAVQKFKLSEFNGSITQWCSLLDTERPLIMEEYRRDWLDRFSLNEFDWLALCHPRMLVPLYEWTQATPLEKQFAALGLPWQELSTAYDLNGDGVNDPLGVVDWLGIYTPWAMLSTEVGYQPLYGLQPWSVATDLATLTDTYLPFSRPNAVTITDLDADGAPEWLFDHGRGFDLMAWVDNRFSINYAFQDQATSAFSASISLAPQLDGTQHVITSFLPDSTGNQPTISQIEYGLHDGKLEQRVPTALDMSTNYGYGYSAPSINTIYRALFERKDSELALAMLAELDQVRSDRWSQHEAMLLKALALEYNGQFVEASQLLNVVANPSETTGWSRFLQQRR